MSQKKDKIIRREARRKAAIMAGMDRFGTPQLKTTPVDPAASKVEYWNPVRVRAFFKGVRHFKKLAKK